jgi:hypothetical protein
LPHLVLSSGAETDIKERVAAPIHTAFQYSPVVLNFVSGLFTLYTMSAKLHQRPPFRAEHLGSLLRPEPLLDIRHKIDKGEKGLEKELEGVEDTSVNEIMKEQLDLGFHAVSDGEYRRHMFW